MMSNIDTYEMWPALPFREWDDTAITLQLWTQIVGKVRLSLTPWLNHGWHVPLYVTARGLGTSPIPIGEELLEMEFDFIAHRLLCRTSRGDDRMLALRPRTVADRSEEHTSELQSLMRISYAVFCLKKKKKKTIELIQ